MTLCYDVIRAISQIVRWSFVVRITLNTRYITDIEVNQSQHYSTKTLAVAYREKSYIADVKTNI